MNSAGDLNHVSMERVGELFPPLRGSSRLRVVSSFSTTTASRPMAAE